MCNKPDEQLSFPQYGIIPRDKRKCNYSACICDGPDELWAEPIYKVGDSWKTYGGVVDRIYTIEMISEEQIVTSYKYKYYDGSVVTRFAIFDCFPGMYAGSPQLRIKVSSKK